MSPGIDSQPPAAYLHLCEALASRGVQTSITLELGGLARVLAASRPAGVFLCLGRGAGEVATWILDGMDLSARLVVVVPDNDTAGMLGPVLGDDLRVTVHVQDPLDFLRDVRDHRFDLITDFDPGHAAELTRLALHRLTLGAFYLSRHASAELTEVLAAQSPASGDAGQQVTGLVCAQLPTEPGISLVVHGPRRFQAKRRGGRRARQGVTPLFSPRPKRGR